MFIMSLMSVYNTCKLLSCNESRTSQIVWTVVLLSFQCIVTLILPGTAIFSGFILSCMAFAKRLDQGKEYGLYMYLYYSNSLCLFSTQIIKM